MKSFLLIQLVFNILILVGLITLAVGGRGRTGRSRRGGKTGRSAEVSAGSSALEAAIRAGREEASAAGRHRAVSRSSSQAGGQTAGLGDLIDRADKQELVAESALKQRLERLRAQATG